MSVISCYKQYFEFVTVGMVNGYVEYQRMAN